MSPEQAKKLRDLITKVKETQSKNNGDNSHYVAWLKACEELDNYIYEITVKE